MNFFKKKINEIREKLYKKHPVLYSFIFFIWLVYSLFYCSFNLVKAFTGKAPLELIGDPSTMTDNSKYYYSDFSSSDIKKWNGYTNLVAVDKENGIFKPKITSRFLGGRDVFFPKELSPDFNAKFVFIPMNEEKINIALNYGYLLRIIVGNGDYNQVQLQYNSKYPEKNLKKDDWIEIETIDRKKWLKRNSGLKPKKRIEVIVNSQAKYNSNKIFLTIGIIGFFEGESERREEKFIYEIKTNKKSENFSEMVGIGFLDPFEEGIETKLEKFELHEL